MMQIKKIKKPLRATQSQSFTIFRVSLSAALYIPRNVQGKFFLDMIDDINHALICLWKEGTCIYFPNDA